MHRTPKLWLLFFSLFLLPAVGVIASGSGESEAPVEQSGYTVTHAMGETLIPETPQRIVTLTQGSTEAVIALGISPVGAVQGWGADPWYPHWEEPLAETEVVGGETQPNVEAIAALAPDLIIGARLRHDEALYEQLSAIAPTVFTETIGESWRENLPLISAALDRAGEGEALLTAYEQRVTEVSAALEEAGLSEATVSLVRFNPGQVRLYDGYPGAIMRDIGLSLPEAQQEILEGNQLVTFTSRERIPVLDADMMFIWSTDWWDPGQAEATRNEWTETELWQNLPVVESGEIYQVSAVYWNLAGGILSARQVLEDVVTLLELE